jgi:hypothetical protein
LTVNFYRPDGVTFAVSAQNVKPGLRPKVGDIVTFSYEDFSRKASPVNPNIYRIRADVSWKDVVRNFEEEAAFSKQMEEGIPPPSPVCNKEIKNYNKWNT